MADELHLTGNCLCGAVMFSAVAAKPSVSVCHCSMCRRWSAGPFMALNCQSVSFEDEDPIGIIRSSDWAERGYCTRCGSNLFYRIIGNSDYQIAAGLFDDQSSLRISLQVFIDDKPDFYSLANQSKEMTGAQVIALFTPPNK